MPHNDSVEKQLAREESLLAETRREILSTEERIEEAERLAVELRQRVGELEGEAEAIAKRVELLRQYIDMAAPSAKAPASSVRPKPKPKPEAEPEPEREAAADFDDDDTGYPIHEAPADSEDEAEPLEAEPEPFEFESEALDLEGGLPENVSVGGPPAQKIADTAPNNFDDLDEDALAMEVLPRTQTFEEELLLTLAHHRKALEPKEVAKLFRRLDHTPKVKPTESNIKAQIASAPHLYEQPSEGRIALSQEGREEAQRLLMSLA